MMAFDSRTTCLWASAKLAKVKQLVAPELDLRWVPGDEKSVSRAAGAFTEYVDENLFPIFWFEDERVEEVIDLMEGPIPVTPLGYDPWDGEDRYHDYEKDDPVRMFLLLMELFHLQGSEEEMWECYSELIQNWDIPDPAPVSLMYVTLDAILSSHPQPEWIGPNPELWQGMMHFCQYLVASTENFFLDATLTMLGYTDACSWNEADVVKAAWAEAKPIWDSLLSFRAWAREHVDECKAMVRRVCETIAFDINELSLHMEEGDEEE